MRRSNERSGPLCRPIRRLAFALLFAATSAALAADLPAPAPIPPPAYVPPVYNWTGFYIGGNIGAGWSGLSDTNTNFSDTLGSTFSAPTNAQFLGGGQVGVNYQFANGIVIGAEAMFDWLSNSQNAMVTATDPTGTVAANIGTSNARWLTTVSGRLGYAWDRVLLYAKGGGAWVATNSSCDFGRGHTGELHQHQQHHEFGLYSRVRRRVGFFRQLVGARRVRLHRAAQPELYGSASDAHFRRRRHHIQQSQHFNGHRSGQLQIRRLVILKMSPPLIGVVVHCLT